MRIKNISIKNFRNYPELSIKINSDTIILTGPNAVGKTNLLEAVYFASLFKSFRDDNEAIFLKGSSNAEIKVVIEKGQEDHLLEIFLLKKEKIYGNFLIDGVKKKRKEAQGFIKVVIFNPTDVDIFNKPPEARRKYLNMVLAQKSADYLENLSQYKRVLYQKNKLLQDSKQGVSNAKDLEAWNEQLVGLGSQIIFTRRQFVNFLNQNISEVYSTISGFHRPVEVFYKTLDGESTEEIAHNFHLKLENLNAKELSLGVSLVGPHRDDFFLKSEGLFLPPFSSRGELRSQIVALKILEMEFLNQAGEKLVLLLDDVLSELDETRRSFLLKYLQGKYQTFITTTYPLEMAAQHITLTPVMQEEVE
jgi:DNA replication and repair protein RecF